MNFLFLVLITYVLDKRSSIAVGKGLLYFNFLNVKLNCYSVFRKLYFKNILYKSMNFLETCYFLQFREYIYLCSQVPKKCGGNSYFLNSCGFIPHGFKANHLLLTQSVPEIWYH